MLKKYQKIFASIVGAFAVLSIFFLFNRSDLNKPKVCFKKNCFNVEVADSMEDRINGLMFREELEQGGGMLFIFEQEDVHSFWMKNTRIPLDIIWVNKDKEVTFISKNVQSCSDDGICPTINPEKSALYVLEINAGLADKIGIKVGDRADFKI